MMNDETEKEGKPRRESNEESEGTLIGCERRFSPTAAT